MKSDIVRVLRIVEYVGPRDWMELTLARSLTHRSGKTPEGQNYRITAATITQFPEILERAALEPEDGEK